MAAKNRAERIKSKAEAVRAKRVPCPYRTGDVVYILSGKSRGTTGEFMKYDAKRNMVFVQGRNMVKHFVKANPDINRQAGEVSVELPIHVSSTAYYCRECSKPSSIRRREEVTKTVETRTRIEDGVEVTREIPVRTRTVSFVCRRCGAERPRRRKA
ncbi:MAG: 50S ribosomal protein L24 [Deltaproteobacteria bacterium]|jgi:large subunit ribosomal protein L24|nr:50S ribosomal protein L24 [Deltaproteobacteria bacterium]